MFSNGLACNLPFSCMSVNRDSGSDELLPSKTSREPVLLNVYDMYKINEITTNIGLGVYHSGNKIKVLPYYSKNQSSFGKLFVKALSKSYMKTQMQELHTELWNVLDSCLIIKITIPG
ncbi:unnamed protein product [Acanthoscelides obtectus]|uniref:Uncharacterized protein n=1 Tax=Acanthoscelides obtectus TaxID=200917 RepID=A0A9P0LLF7_ACAOB|nr:unnamed protein product [Acanthoscelides obtectus]CAK1675997.1 Desumoylating isopeptidase 2 [Acanthoscelides obtectus]